MNSDLWPPHASIAQLKQRAAVLMQVRRFFAERGVFEVETPLLSRYSVTDPHMQALSADNPLVDKGDRYYLQTSPEYAMKRLLAAGSGAIYQLCKAFRRFESGSKHNPEFTLLEWYRPGFDYFQLMDEVAALLECVLGPSHYEKISYRALFQQHLQIDPHRAECRELRQLALRHIDIQLQSDCRDDWLNVLLSHVIEPKLRQQTVFIYDYPATQAALARIARDDTGERVAQRFELYVNAVELANGYFELTDVTEQERRFEQERRLRRQQGKISINSDKYLLAAMAESGLPECSGVALGIDRLVMLALGCSTINDVLTFPVARA